MPHFYGMWDGGGNNSAGAGGRVTLSSDSVLDSVGLNITPRFFGSAVSYFTTADTPSGTVLPIDDASGLIGSTQKVGGPNIANNTHVVSVGLGTVTISVPLLGDVPSDTLLVFGTKNVKVTGADSPSGNTMSFTSVSGINVGDLVSGHPNIDPSAVVNSITPGSAGTLVISSPVLGDIPSGTLLTFGSTTTKATRADTPSGSTLPFTATYATSSDTPSGTILNISGATIAVTDPVTGLNIAPATTVKAIGSGTITLSLPILGDIPNGTLIKFGGTNLVVAGARVFGVNVQPKTSVLAVTTDNVTLSLPLTGDVPSGNTIIFITTQGYGSPVWEDTLFPQLKQMHDNGYGLRWFRAGARADSGDSTPHKALYLIRMQQLASIGMKASIVRAAESMLCSILPQTNSCTGSITGTTLTVTAQGSGLTVPGTLFNEAQPGTQVLSQLTGQATSSGPTLAGGTSSVAATGSISFVSNLSEGNTITLGGTVLTATATPITANQFLIDPATLDATLSNLMNLLNTSSDGNIIKSTYVLTGETLNVTYGVVGTVGNSFVISPNTGGGVGTYSVNLSQSFGSGSLTGSYGLLVVGQVVSGTVGAGDPIFSPGITVPGTVVAGAGAGATGKGGVGTYYVTPSQTVPTGNCPVAFACFTNFQLDVFPAYVLDGSNWGEIEGPNEPNVSVLNAPFASVYQKAMWAAVQADPVLGPGGAAIKVTGPGVTAPATNWKNLGDMTPFEDYGNMHPYSGSCPDGGNLENYLAATTPLPYGSEPIIISEVGWSSSLGQKSGPPVAPNVIARYVPRLFLYSLLKGTLGPAIPRTILFQLIPTHAPNQADVQAGYGLINYDGTLTQVYNSQNVSAWNSFVNMQTLFADPGSPFTANPLSYSFSGPGLDATVKTLAFQKRNGTYMLAAWIGTNGWDPQAQVPISVPPKSLTLQVSPTFSNATSQVFNDDGTLTTTTILFSGGSATVTVTDQMQVLTLH